MPPVVNSDKHSVLPEKQPVPEPEVVADPHLSASACCSPERVVGTSPPALSHENFGIRELDGGGFRCLSCKKEYYPKSQEKRLEMERRLLAQDPTGELVAEFRTLNERRNAPSV